MTRTETGVFSILADRGLTLSQALELTDAVLDNSKVAFDPASMLSAAGPYAFLGAAAFPFLGYQGGKYVAKALDAGSGDVSQLQTDELAAQLHAQIEEMKARRELRKRQG